MTRLWLTALGVVSGTAGKESKKSLSNIREYADEPVPPVPVEDVEIHEGGRANIGVVGEWGWRGSFISGMESGNGSERISSCREGERAPTSGRAVGDNIEVDTFGESVPSYPSKVQTNQLR